MRKLRWLVVAVVGVLVVGCSSSGEPMAVELSVPMSLGGGEASGAAVDEEVICPSGTFTRLRMEDPGGAVVSDEDGAELWDDALESGATIEMFLYDEFNCSDGSGSISIVVDNVVQPSTLDFEGSNDAGTWEIQGGTGSYEELTGKGAYTVDFGNGVVFYAGEIQQG